MAPPPPRSSQPRRKNGFSPPFTGAQVSTWIALPLLIIEFLIFVAPTLPLEASVPCTIVFGITAVLSAYYAAMASMIDPMDEHLAKYLKQKESKFGTPICSNLSSVKSSFFKSSSFSFESASKTNIFP